MNELGVRNDRAAVHIGVGIRGGAEDVGPTIRRRKFDRHSGVDLKHAAMVPRDQLCSWGVIDVEIVELGGPLRGLLLLNPWIRRSCNRPR